MIIKVCGMRDIRNIRELTLLKPDLVGFIFYPKSKRYVGEAPDNRIFDIVSPNIQSVGVFVNEDQGKLLEIAHKYALKFIQLHGGESPEYCYNIKKEGFKILKSFGISQSFDFNVVRPYTTACDYFLFDTSTREYGGSGKKFDWSVLDNYQLEKEFFLSGGIGPDDTDYLTGKMHPKMVGIDVNSKFELEPALKDIKKLSEFISKLR